MIRYIVIISVLACNYSILHGQLDVLQNDEYLDFFDEKLFLHVVQNGIRDDTNIYEQWCDKNEVTLSENLTNYSYKKPISNIEISQVDNPQIILDLVKRDILNQDYINGFALIQHISFSDLPKNLQDDYQFYKAYLLFVNKNFEMARKIFDSSESVKNDFKYSSIYYSAFCDMFSGNYTASAEKFTMLQSHKKYKKDLPYYMSLLYYKEEMYSEVITLLSGRIRNTSSIHKDAMTNILSRAYYKESKWNKLSDVLLSDANCCESKEQHYFVGLSLYKQKKYNLAIPHLSSAIDLTSEEAQNALLALGHIHQNSNPELSVSYFIRASQLSYNIGLKEQAIVSLAIYYEENGEYEKAIQYTSRINEDSDFFVNALHIESRIHYSNKNYYKALKTVLRIKDLNPKFGRLYQDLLLKNGSLAYQNGDREKAKYYLDEASILDLDPDAQRQATYILARIYFDNKNYNKALDILNKHEKLTHNSKLNTGSSPLQASYLKAYCLLNIEDYKASIIAFTKSEHLLKEAFKNNALSIYESQYEDILLRKADCLLKVGHKSKAEHYYSRAFEQSINHGDYALYQKGKIEDLLNEPYLQIATYDKLEKSYPHSKYLIDAQLKKGIVLLKLGKDKDAYDQFVKVYQSQKASETNKFFALMRLGLISYNQGDIETALIYYKRLFKGTQLSKEQSREALTVIEEIYLNQLKDSESYYAFLNKIGDKNITNLNKDSIDFYIAYDEIMSNKQSALNKLTIYLEKHPNGTYFTKALMELAKIHEIQAEYNNAISRYKQLLELSPKYIVISLERIIYNLSKMDNRYEDYIKYNKEILALNISHERNSKAYAQIAKAALKSGQTLDYEKEILLALETNEFDLNEKENIRLSLANIYIKNRYYSKAISHLKELSKSNDHNIASEALYMVAERLYLMHKTDETKIVLDKLMTIPKLNKNTMSKAILIKSRIYLSDNEIELAKVAIEAILNQKDINQQILKEADEFLKVILKKQKEFSEIENSTLELQYLTNE